MTTKPEYSADEKRLIFDVYESGADIKSQMHLFPGRSYAAVINRARRWGLGKISVMDLVHEIMKDGEPRTSAELEKLTGGRRKYICENLRVASLELGTYHIAGWEGAHLAAVFKAGYGENVPRPEYTRAAPKIIGELASNGRRSGKTNKSEKPAKAAQRAPKALVNRTTTRQPSEAELDAKYRNRGYWWPAADPVVTDAMRAMMAVATSPAGWWAETDRAAA